jgi:hypothetical protein
LSLHRHRRHYLSIHSLRQYFHNDH